MHSGRTTGWTGQIDWPPAPAAPRHGRHRKCGSDSTWTPVVPPIRPAQALAPPRQVDPLADTSPAGGLHKFDLGMVPASVTPPATWRRAAWFAVASSAAALGGLLLVSSAVVGNSTKVESLPKGGGDPQLDPYYLSGDPTRPQARTTGWVRPVPALSRPVATKVAVPESIERVAEPPLLLATPDPESIERRTSRYFDAIGGGDLRTAFRMTTGQLRHEGFRAFASRYSEVTSVEVTEVRLVPGRAVCTLRLVTEDGEVLTQRRELRFSAGDQTMIHSDAEILD